MYFGGAETCDKPYYTAFAYVTTFINGWPQLKTHFGNRRRLVVLFGIINHRLGAYNSSHIQSGLIITQDNHPMCT